MFEGDLPRHRPTRRAERLLLTSATISFLTLLEAISGYLVDALLAARFGVGEETDALFSAHTVPFVVSNVAQVMTLSLATVLARWRTAENQRELWQVFNPIATWIGLVAVAFALVGVAASEQLVRLITPGFDSETMTLAARLTRVIFVCLPFLMLGPIVRSFLYAHERFAFPLSMGLVQNLIRFVAIYFFSRGFGIFAAAWGEVVGVMAETVACAGLLALYHGFHYRISFRLSHRGVREALSLAVAPASNTVMVRGISIVERIVASYLQPGSLTALRYGNRILHSLEQALLRGVTLSIGPVLSVNMAAAEMDRASQELKRAVKLAAFLVIPTIVGIWLLRVPLITVLFQRGAFDEDATHLTATVLGVYVLALFAIGHTRTFSRLFYASLERTKIITVTALSSTATIILDLILPRFLGVTGLALGYALGMTVAAVAGAVLVHRYMAGFPWGEIALFEWKLLVAAAGMGVGIRLAHPWARQAFGDGRFESDVWALALAVASGIVAFGLCAWLLRIRERELVVSFVRRRLGRRGRRRARP